jgi:hypothetical protein
MNDNKESDDEFVQRMKAEKAIPTAAEATRIKQIGKKNLQERLRAERDLHNQD